MFFQDKKPLNFEYLMGYPALLMAFMKQIHFLFRDAIPYYTYLVVPFPCVPPYTYIYGIEKEHKKKHY